MIFSILVFRCAFSFLLFICVFAVFGCLDSVRVSERVGSHVFFIHVCEMIVWLVY